MKKLLNQFGNKPLIKKEGGSLVQQEHIKNRITILPEFESLIPPLLPDEYNQLEANILKEGCREPLLIWQTTQGVLDQSADDTSLFVLIDGHNRFSICQRHGLEFKLSLREFDDKEAVRDFMIDNQLGRRNLTAEQMSYLRGQKYLVLKKKQGRPLFTDSADQTTKKSKVAVKRTDEKLADQFNVSPKTIRLDADFAKGADRMSDTLKKEVLSRKSKIRKSDVVKLGTLENLNKRIETVEELTAVLHSAPEQTPPAEKVSASSTPDGALTHYVGQLKQLATTLDSRSPDFEEVCQEILTIISRILTKSF